MPWKWQNSHKPHVYFTVPRGSENTETFYHKYFKEILMNHFPFNIPITPPQVALSSLIRVKKISKHSMLFCGCLKNIETCSLETESHPFLHPSSESVKRKQIEINIASLSLVATRLKGSNSFLIISKDY